MTSLPTAPLPQTIDGTKIRIGVHGPAGSGKTTLMSGWYPESTLAIDFDDSWSLLPGEHYRVTPPSYAHFRQVVNDLTATEHRYRTTIVDTFTRAWRMADLEAGQRYGKVAAGTVEYGKGTADRDGTFMRDMGALLTSPLGVVFMFHSTWDDDAKLYRPKIDERIKDDILGALDFLWFIDHRQPQARKILTNVNSYAECKTRFTAMPESIPLPADPIGAANTVRSALQQAAVAQAPAATTNTTTKEQ